MIEKFSRWLKGRSDSSTNAPVENSLSDDEALRLKPLSKGHGEEPGGDVIYVHGLGGDLYGTWAVSEGGEKVHWARWLAETRPDLSFWTLGYPASPSLWTGRAMPLQDRAVNVLALLKANGIGKRPVCFITHSLGGLLVKQMLRAAISGGTEEYTLFGKSARGVVFLSTPHTGSDLATLVNYLKLILRTSMAIEDLRDNGALLRDLNSWYINHVEKFGIMSKVFFETRPTFGQTIVDESSAALFVRGVSPIAIDANHIEICKPLSRESLVYKVTRDFVDEIFPPRANGEGMKRQPSITSEGEEKKRVQWMLVLSGTFEDIDKEQAEAIVQHLRQLSGDMRLTIRKVESGSVKLTIESSEEGFQRIKTLLSWGQLHDVLGFGILGIELDQEARAISEKSEGKTFETTIDLTDRKHAEEMLRESEERLRLALEGTQAGVWEVRFDPYRAYWSKEYRALFGFSDADEAIFFFVKPAATVA